MISKSLELIDQQDIGRLVADGIVERRDLEFKRDLPGSQDADLREFLADIVSLANAQGGDLVFGIEEAGGAAARVVGVKPDDPDATLLAIENRVRDCVEPRLFVACRLVPLGDGSSALVIRVPASLGAPHCVRFKGSRRFFSRTSNGKYEMDTHELRQAFVASEGLPSRLRALHQRAVAASRGEDMPFPMANAPVAVMSVMPLGLFREVRSLPITPMSAVAPHNPKGAIESMLMLEGVLLHRPLNEDVDEATPTNSVASYALTHWEGRVDAAWTIGRLVEMRRDEQRALVWPKLFEAGVIDIATASVARLRELGVVGPWLMAVTVYGIEDFELVLSEREQTAPTWRTGAALPEVIVDHASEAMLKPLFDAFWLLFGRHRPEGRPVHP
jgi:hypothetical protein